MAHCTFVFVLFAIVCSASSAATAQQIETVRLQNGGFVRGTIVEWVPDDYATVVTVDGQSRIIPWAEIDPSFTPNTERSETLPSAEWTDPARAPQAPLPVVQVLPVRPFEARDGGYAYFDVSVTPPDTEIRVRRVGARDTLRACDGRCIVELPARLPRGGNQILWEFSASRGRGAFWGYGSEVVRAAADVGEMRPVHIELRHNVWANVSLVTGIALVVGGGVGLLVTALGDDCGIFDFGRAEGCTTLNVMYLVGFAAIIVGWIHPPNTSTVSTARPVQARLEPGGLTLNF